jgi:hypothetical protein
MASITAPIARPGEDRVYILLGGLCAAIAFVGFAGTYWLQMVAGTFTGVPLLHLHGLLFSGWTLFFIAQAGFIANGQRARHRAWGLAGISLATAMLFTGVAIAIEGLQLRIAHGQAEAGRAFVIVPLSAIFLFAIFVTAAMVNRRRADWHKRFMLVATSALLNAAIARFFFLVATGGGPGMRPGIGPPLPVESALIPGLLSDSVILLGMFFDWRSRGRPHPAYVWGLGIVLTVQILRAPISATAGWAAFAHFLAHFSG